MSFTSKIINVIASHPKLVTFVIGLAVTFAIGTAIGMVDHGQAFAKANHHNHASFQSQSQTNSGNNNH
jgi:hypothetical protein